ncbi:AbrB/MazE/SpoVT family DNA-binding domain-containing protein [Haladaptatus salinisoli]|uniref:AbrB/MazE/SpoVT family DNA-binding domain-containing protein n=1 Tax=Haladaptatus salinisoli TaxID=2884876 RepID=UPI001D0BCB86|nr:AbrB/MazE/SpoVT family DNA-binding domain-containing protein [Haladaptatus salinisoli]
MTTKTDERGRLYLSKDLRARYGERFHVVEYQDRIELIPVDEDPLEGLREAVGDAFEDKSVDELRQEARDQAVEDAENDVRRD